jgi:competence protein ComGC
MSATRTGFRNADGTALVEVLTAILIMGVGLLSMLALFPVGLLTMRRAVQEDRAGASADRLAHALAALQIEHGTSPASLKDLTPYLQGDGRYADGEDNGYLFVLDAGSLTAVPAAPGKTGVRHFCIKLGSVYDCTRSEDLLLAQASEWRMRLGLMQSAGLAAMEIFASDESGRARALAPAYLQSDKARRAAFDLIDRDDDGLVTFRELLEVAAPNTVLARFFSQVRIQLELGAGDEDIDTLPGVGPSVLTGNALALFSFSTDASAVSAPGMER